MKLTKSITLLMFGLSLVCCKNQAGKLTMHENADIKKPITTETKYTFTEKGVLNLRIGEFMPEELENYKITKTFKIVEEGNEEPLLSVAENNLERLQISFHYDQDLGQFTNKIGEILIKDPKFRTSENIGVESTITDFINSYPDYYIWYTYISDNYVLQSKKNKIQFLLDSSGYIGKEISLDSDMIELKKEDFSSKTKIIAIRIY